MTGVIKEQSREEGAFFLALRPDFARRHLIEILIKHRNENIEATLATGQMVLDPLGGVAGSGSSQVGGEIKLIGAAGRITCSHQASLDLTFRIVGMDLNSRRNQRRMRSVVFATPLTLRPNALILAISCK